MSSRPKSGVQQVITLAARVAALCAAVALLGKSDTSALTLAGFEIDADNPNASDALFAGSATDWAENGSSAAEGVFLLGTSGSPDFLGCYGSDISVNPAVAGTAGLICDGASDSRFDGNGGATFDLDFNRTPGDLLVSFPLVGGGTNPLLEVFAWNGTTFAPAPSLCGGTQGDSLLRTNASNDIQAPPWNVPVCDPTATNGSNSCRVVNQNGTPPAQPGDNLIAPRDFNEAIVDLGAFVSGNVCFNSLLFTSRSAHPLETADLKDVAGANVNTCPPPAGPPAAPPPAAPPAAPPGAPPVAPPGGSFPPVALPPTGARPSSAGATWLLVGVILGTAGVLGVVRSRRH